ncbi:unnamed protein product [Haemonchus placei]|uniref:Selenocysteine insertion sequence-binding protein 2-like n=1 Tax=Haemonchus placei TaxID=6290 RepID=A0A0N4WNG5_HAEPC|nr:unnamed protein product [Haemonchus placei]
MWTEKERLTNGYPGVPHAIVADNDVIRVSLSYERTTKETIDNAFKLLKNMTEQYKKRKDDPKLVTAQSFSKVVSSSELPITMDADLEIGPSTTPPAGDAEQVPTALSAASALLSQVPSSQPSKNSESSTTESQKALNVQPSTTPPATISSQASNSQPSKNSEPSMTEAQKASNLKPGTTPSANVSSAQPSAPPKEILSKK